MYENADLAYPPCLLRPDGERGSEDTSQRAQQEAAAVHYSMTWSARSRSDGAIVRPRAFAVLRLMTSSNVVA